MKALLLAPAVALAASLVATPLFMRLARRLSLVDRPAQDRWSRREVPLLGGAAIFTAFLLSFFLSGAFRGPALAVLPGAVLLFLTGLVDDIRGLRPATKLVVQVAAASLLVAGGVEVRILGDSLFAIPLTILWVVGITNAVNLIDNMDGLCAGVGILASAALAAYAVRYGDEPFVSMALTALALLGAQAGFLLFNFHPARVFMGDAGALFLGYTLASCAILGTYENAGSLILIVAAPLFSLAVPIFDTTFVTVLRRLNRRKVTQGGRDHLSHRLVALGMSERRAVLTLYAVCAILAGLGVAMSYLDLFANLFFMGVSVIAVVILALVLGAVAIYRESAPGPAAEAGEEMRRTFGNYARVAALVVLDMSLLFLAYLGAFLARYDGAIPPFERDRMLESLPVVITARMVFLHVFQLYRGFWRYFGVRDLLAVLKAVLAGSVASVLVILLLFRFEGYSRSLFVVDAMAAFLLISGSRFLFRALTEARYFPGTGVRVLVLGVGDAGDLAVRLLRTMPGERRVAVGFLDGDRGLRSRRILGVPVLGRAEDLERVAREVGAQELVIARVLPAEEQRLFVARASAAGLAVWLAPSATGFVPLSVREPAAAAGHVLDIDHPESGR